MSKAEDTLVFLGSHAGFTDWIKKSEVALMSYLLVFPFFAVFDLSSNRFDLKWLFLGLLAVVLGSLLILKLTKALVHVELVLDRERQQLLIRRRILGFRQLVSLASVEELHGVLAAGEIPDAPMNYFWKYVPLVITRSGGRYRMGQHETDFQAVVSRTRQLGSELCIDVLDPQQLRRVKVRKGPDGPVIDFVSFPLQGLDCLTVVFWGLSVTVTPIIALIYFFS